MKRKARKKAEEFLNFGFKVYHFRRDQMKPHQAETLLEKLEDLKQALKDRQKGADVAIQPKLDTLEPLLKKVGGKLYPRTFLNDNVEMLIVAAIVVIGIRTFFAQPFIIPTNSMYPSYAGVTHHLYKEDKPGPSSLHKLWNLATLGARHKEVISPGSGELLIPLFSRSDERPAGAGGTLAFREVPGKAFGLWPTRQREYFFFVGSQRTFVPLRVPKNFILDPLIEEKIETAGTRGASGRTFIQGQPFLRTGIQLQEGEPILSFDIRLGDMLFVDRMSYHFAKPKVGQPFVFRTTHIESLVDQQGNQEDKYYIKRLVGIPGDTLAVEPPVLLRNGHPIEGRKAFENNHRQLGEFEGYVEANAIAYARLRGVPMPKGYMPPEASVNIPAAYYYAMGDNSDQSLDSRTWGFVPDKDVIGKALFVYYPFSGRWGPGR